MQCHIYLEFFRHTRPYTVYLGGTEVSPSMLGAIRKSLKNSEYLDWVQHCLGIIRFMIHVRKQKKLYIG